MMPTVSQGGATSGNSSVLSRTSAKMPKMTIDTIATTVISGRLIAKSEIIMNSSVARVRAITRVILTSAATKDPFHYGKLWPDSAHRHPSRLALRMTLGGLFPSRIRCCTHFHWRLLRDTARRAEENRVAGGDAGFHFDRLSRAVANAQLDFRLFDHAVLDPHDERL